MIFFPSHFICLFRIRDVGYSFCVLCLSAAIFYCKKNDIVPRSLFKDPNSSNYIHSLYTHVHLLLQVSSSAQRNL